MIIKHSSNIVAFQGVKRVMCYLHMHLHEPIFYPSSPIGNEEKITYNWSPTESSPCSLASLPVTSSDATFASFTKDQRSMEVNTFLINGVIYSWSSNIQRSTAKDSIDAIKKLYSRPLTKPCHRNFSTSSSIHNLLYT